MPKKTGTDFFTVYPEKGICWDVFPVVSTLPDFKALVTFFDSIHNVGIVNTWWSTYAQEHINCLFRVCAANGDELLVAPLIVGNRNIFAGETAFFQAIRVFSKVEDLPEFKTTDGFTPKDEDALTLPFEELVPEGAVPL